jgi:hypothetical protein
MDFENEEDGMNLQASYSSIIQDYKTGLETWLAKEQPVSSIDAFEDRELDTLLLKVSSPLVSALISSSKSSRNNRLFSTRPSPR